MVADGCAVPEDRVRKEFSRVKKLAEIPPTLRGWALERAYDYTQARQTKILPARTLSA